MNIQEFITNISSSFESFLLGLGIWGGVISCFFIIIESMIPILPLCAFITMNFVTFGNLVGFLISWLFTCVGCSLSFFICRYFFREKFTKKYLSSTEENFGMKLMNKIDKMKLSSLAIVIAIPFTPAFLVNIVASQSKMTYKKFLIAILIGKIFMVYFWGYIGSTLIESVTDPTALIEIVIMLIIAYLLGKLVNKFLKLD